MTTNTTGLIAAAFFSAWLGLGRACSGPSAAASSRQKPLLKLRRLESHCRLRTLAFYKLATAILALTKRLTKMLPQLLRLRWIESTRCLLRRLSLSIREISRNYQSRKSSTPSTRFSRAAGPRMFSTFLGSTMCSTMAESFTVKGT